MAKKPKKRASKKTQALPLPNSNRSLIIIGAVLITLSLVLKTWDIYQTSQPTFKNYQPQRSQSNRAQTTPKNIIIPDILINLGIEEGNADNNNWNVSEVGVNHLKTSSHPSENGNIVIYGHNWTGLLGKIRQLKTGNRILVTTADGKTYTYIVSETIIVKPTEVWILDKTDEEILTIYTCTGFLDLERFVVRAKPATD